MQRRHLSEVVISAGRINDDSDMQATHQDAETRYDRLRRQALATVQQIAPSSIHYGLIDARAQQAAESWRSASDRRVDWDWTNGFKTLKYRHPKRFEVAVWQTGKLIALSFGRPTYNGNRLRLDLIEARPASLGDRDSAFPRIVVAYDVYARLIGAREIRVMNPINAEVRAYYERLGFEYVRKGNYVHREIR